MSRLGKKLREYIRTRGIDGKADLCKRTKRGMRTVERWAEEGNIPEALQLDVALQCCAENQEEALALIQRLPEAKGKAS